MTRLSCSECGCPTYVVNHSLEPGDFFCELCGHFVCYVDFQLDDGERITFDDDGYVCVASTIESVHAYGYYEEN